MAENLVLYESRYGASKQYAKWLQDMIECDVKETGEKLPQDLRHYRKILIAGGLYGGRFAGMGFINKNHEALKMSEVAVLAVGAEAPYRGLTEQIWLEHFKTAAFNVEVFYARGEFDYKSLKLPDKMMLKAEHFIHQRRTGKHSEIGKIMQNGKKAYDWKDKLYLEPVVEWFEAD